MARDTGVVTEDPPGRRVLDGVPVDEVVTHGTGRDTVAEGPTVPLVPLRHDAGPVAGHQRPPDAGRGRDQEAGVLTLRFA